MRLVLYSNIARKIGGLFTFERIFCKTFADKFDITYVYKSAEGHSITEISKYVKVLEDNGQKIETDICIYSSVQHKSNIKAHGYIQVCHSDFKFWNAKYVPENIDVHIAVGESVAQSLKEGFGVESVVIPNMLEAPQVDKVLRLLTASRISEGKGFARIVDLAKKLKAAKKKFVWEIYGAGAHSFINSFKYKLSGINEVVLMGERTEMQSYMVDVDYVVQLSDNEGFCYSIHEALQVKTPVIVTNWVGVDKVVENGKNGYILDMDLNNLDIDKLYNSIPKSSKLKVNNNPAKVWETLLNNLYFTN